MDEDYQVI